MKPLVAALLACAFALAAPAAAQQPNAGPPDAEAVRKAASAFDEGSRAYRGEQYELAASHFEAADAAVPSAQALRMAIRARTEAGQLGRASTLSELAIKRYPSDDKTTKLAKQTVDANASKLHRLKISCASPCVLALGHRSVPGALSKKWTLWVPPGQRNISASFGLVGGADQQVIVARKGGKNTLTFLPNKDTSTPVKPPKPAAPKPKPSTKPTKPKPAPLPEPGPDEVQDDSMWIEHPAVFVVSLLLTAGAGGTLIWSGVDTLQSPGTETVQQECAGLGTDCDAYQQGLRSQLRTNILIGATGGLGLITGIIGIFVTDWGGDEDTGVSLTPGGMTLHGRF